MSDIVELPDSAGDEGQSTGMYVMTNSSRLNGAPCMTFEDVLFNLSKSLNSGLYILPSSIHEIIIVPAACGEDMECMSDMVRQVNETALEKEEILSDHAYYFDPGKGYSYYN